MDDFRKYEKMRDAGATAPMASLTARMDGLDAMERIRMVRALYGLSLKEAKAIQALCSSTDNGQNVAPGKKLYWESMESDGVLQVWEAIVDQVRDGMVQLSGHRRYIVTADRLVETPVGKPVLASAPLDMFKCSLSERLCRALPAMDEIPQSSREAV